ncbi:MAG: hypothetical protein AB8H12_06150 [Lewinella sp.]
MYQGSWPFGKLKVSSDRLEVSVSIKKVVFAPEDVVAIEPYMIIPLIGQGIRVVHRVEKYSQKVVFFGFSSPDEIIRRINKTNFLEGKRNPDREKSEEIAAAQSQGGNSFKLTAIIVGLVAWNAPILWGAWSMLVKGGEYGPEFYQGVLVSLGLLFVASLGLVAVEPFRKLILRGGDEDGVRKMGWFLMLLSGIMFLSFLLIYRTL